MRRRKRLLLILIFFMLMVIGWQFLPPPAYPSLPTGYIPQLAVWLDITWVMERHTDAEIDALAQALQTHGVDYVFAYVSYLKPEGYFNPTFDHALNFTRRFAVTAPEITLLAWVGVPLYADPNRLSNLQTRDQIVEFAIQTVTEMGFAGFHLNAEPAVNGETGFIDTLRAIVDALPTEVILSTTAHALRLEGNVIVTPYPTLAHHWSNDYLRLVADNSDQVVLMAYDSGLFLPADYRAWVEYQVRESAQAIEGTPVNFLIGVPTSEEHTMSHWVTTEYLANALYGVRAGLASTNDYSNIDGIAIYPYWEADVREWDALSVAFTAAPDSQQ